MQPPTRPIKPTIIGAHGTPSHFLDFVDDACLLANVEPTHRKIFVHDVGWDATAKTLTSMFGKYDEIEDCKDVTDKVLGKLKGYTFILFKHMNGAHTQKKIEQRPLAGRRRSTSATPSPLSPIPLLSTPQDDHNATVYDSESDGDHPPAPLPDFIPEPEPVDLLDENTCISCNEGEGALLACSERGCPVTVHVSCIGSQPQFDDSGNFHCPYCWYKRAVNKSRELREKATLAKKALSSFLDEGQTVRKDEEEPLAEPVQDPVNRDEPRVSDSEEEKERVEVETEHHDKGKVSVTGSSVSETKDSDSEAEAISVKKGKGHAKAKRKVQKKVGSVKKSLLRERNTGDDDVDEEVTTTSTRTLRSPKHVTKPTLLTGKRKRLLWTAEEEKALKEGVLKFSMENQNIPWRKILEFGCRVFDKTRTPVDLKDKWKNITSKEGCR